LRKSNRVIKEIPVEPAFWAAARPTVPGTVKAGKTMAVDATYALRRSFTGLLFLPF
jgi:hypothetical protein